MDNDQWTPNLSQSPLGQKLIAQIQRLTSNESVSSILVKI